MFLMLLAVSILVLSGVLSLVLGRQARRATVTGVGGAVLGGLIGLVPTVSVLWTGRVETWRGAWQVPLGSFSVQLDALSAFFLLPILGLATVAALYGGEYLMAYRSRKNLGAAWFFFNLLVASMVMVALAQNGVLFLLAWEIMSLASFFLVTFENEQETVRQAGWTYLVATHLGTVFLLVLFLLLGRQAGSLDFDRFLAASGSIAPMAGVAFSLALIGFGTKAGFMPLHVWLPEAHPAAPSHVSALMSGVMIKTGIYGLLRTLTFLGPPASWWGWVLIGIGLVSGLGGVLFALAQHDLKRLLAYHSVENIGIIALGLGVGVLGLALHQPALAVLGLAGGLLHVLNHALFKGLLFLGAGAVIHATGTRDIEHLGGLIRRMPWTAAMFFIGSVAICGLPPLNGFVSEFLIYVGAFTGLGLSGVSVWGTATIAGLAMIGGLAAACFTKAFGIVFLGEPRSELAHVHEAGWAMLAPMAVLAIGCVAVGFLAPQVVAAMKPVIGSVTGLGNTAIEGGLALAIEPLRWVVVGFRDLRLDPGPAGLAASPAPVGKGSLGEWNLGLRLCPAHRAHAIHRIIICPAAHEHVRLPPPDPVPLRGPRRFFPGACRLPFGNRRPFSRKPFSASLSRYRAALTLVPLAATRPGAALYPLCGSDPAGPAGVESEVTP